MSDMQRADGSPETPADQSKRESSLFAAKEPEGHGMPLTAWAVAGLVVLAIVGGLIFAGRRKATGSANTIQPLAAYATNLPLSQLVMSESVSLSGGKSTFVDGHIQNAGTQTITGVTVQVLFRNEEQMPPQVETMPLTLIRTHDPYVDTQSVSATPLKPGDDREFRLIFEAIPANWNMRMPDIHVVRVQTR